MAALLAACGGGGGGDGDATKATQTAEVSPAGWAGAVCDHIGSWLQGVQALSTNFASAVQNVGADLDAARSQLSDFFGELVQRTDEMIQAVDDAGVPETEKGRQVADDLKAGLVEVRQAFQNSQARIQGLPTGDPAAFEQEAQQAFTELTTAGDKIGEKFQSLDQKYNIPALQKAFQEAPECKQLNR